MFYLSTGTENLGFAKGWTAGHCGEWRKGFTAGFGRSPWTWAVLWWFLHENL